jgi:hypothetical protein
MPSPADLTPTASKPDTGPAYRFARGFGPIRQTAPTFSVGTVAPHTLGITPGEAQYLRDLGMVAEDEPCLFCALAELHRMEAAR